MIHPERQGRSTCTAPDRRSEVPACRTASPAAPTQNMRRRLCGVCRYRAPTLSEVVRWGNRRCCRLTQTPVFETTQVQICRNAVWWQMGSVSTLVGQLFGSASDNGLPPRPDEATWGYLDAAVRCVERYGWQRTSVKDVARQAGVDRTTVYRHVGSMDDIFRLIVAREVHLLVDAIPSADSTRDDCNRSGCRVARWGH